MKGRAAHAAAAAPTAIKRRSVGYLFRASLLLLLPTTLWAHAVLVRSAPAERAHVRPGSQTITLTYNSRVDAARSTLMLVRPDGTRQALTLEPHTPANILTTRADLPRPGDYQVEWQVLSVDGHITRGSLQFHVD